MYLSKLEIFGFKSFAQKATFEFKDGITAIIGPNGCGKSNIVDAIRWVLGEQRPSLLRLDRMENVIFNGTAKRKPLSMAEVSLYLENNKGILPSIYTEVKITRRLYRSGESEYLINNQPVRLKDIIDLFADTGMGSDAYSVIELKMVEQILSENAEERRRLFEEAAGIKKYKYRRKAALRKLEHTDQELVRLNDVISEVQKTVNSLSRQVGKARRYHQFKKELQENELYVFQLKSQIEEQDLLPLTQEEEMVRQTRERLGKDITVQEAELEKHQALLVDLEQEFRKVSGRLHQADEAIRSRQETLRLNEQKMESTRDNIRQRENLNEELQKKIAHLKAELDALGENQLELQQKIADQQKSYSEKANRQLELEEELESARTAYQAFRQENMNLLSEINQQKAAYQEIQYKKNNLRQQQEKKQRQLEQVSRLKEERQSALEAAESELQEAREELEMYEKELAHLNRQLETLSEKLPQLESEQNKLIGQLTRLNSQKEFLERLIANYAGFSETVQQVMSRKEQFNGLVDTLANLVDTEDEYRPALESYLQDVSNYLIVREVETAQRILSDIRRNGKGRITILPLSELVAEPTPANGAPEGEGVLPLRQLVTCEDGQAGLFDRLLHNVFLVPDLQKALELHRLFPQCRFVTREGEVVGRLGSISGGTAGKSMNLTGRKQQYEKLTRESESLQTEREKLAQEIEQTRRSLAEKRQKSAEFRKLVSEQQREIQKQENRFNQAEYEIQHLQRQISDLEQEIRQDQQALEELAAAETQLFPKVEEADKRQQEYYEKDRELSEKVSEADRAYRQLSREVQEIQISLLNSQSQLGEQAQKQTFLRQSIEEAEKQIERNRQEMRTYAAAVDEIHEQNQSIRRELEGMYQSRDKVEADKNEIERRYQAQRSDILGREEELKKLHRKWNQALDRLKELELRIQELKVRKKSRREQMEEKYGEELDRLLLENPLPENAMLADLQENISQLRRKIEALGEVNPLAIKEYETEKERLDFLKSQQNDLLEAKNELTQTINKLNKTARQLFMETFERINNNFKNVFSKFFENGEGELRLVESNDPLESNIDISVKIKGRKLSTLTLMSAGEKTLTAISLLFSIYLVKPSPFCIFDEVDAPLDDINIARYTNAIREFSDNTQFILVTHNKMTMQAAQAMYGITMEEPGVSKVVSVSLD